MGAASPDDYYALLGIDAEADDRALRRAWRRLALRWHPDRAGPDATAMFQKILAAYTVLSDPIARAAYDRRRRDASPKRAAAAAEPADASAKRAAAKPRPADASSEPAPTDAKPAATGRRAPGVLLHRLSGPLNVLLARGVARHAGGDVIELFLDEEEVAEGGMVTISMRVPVRCPACARDVAKAAGPCAACGSTRTIEDLFSAWLAIRPGVADGTILHPSAQLPGMLRPVSFRVRLGEATPG